MLRVLRNEDVVKVIAFIPPGHVHTRLLIILRDGNAILMQHATVDGIIRAFTSVALHPVRRVSELVGKYIPKSLRKQGFAEWQLIESGRSEDEVLDEVIKFLRKFE